MPRLSASRKSLAVIIRQTLKHILYIFLLAFSVTTSGQTFTKLSIKFAPTISGQIKSPKLFADGGIKYGLSGTIEPTILTFGFKKQFDFNTDISFIQKGGLNYSPVYSYDQWGQLIGIGSETYPVIINYISFFPTIKAIFWKIIFVKAGPRIDAFVSFKKQDKFSSDQRTNKDFNPTTFGATYGIGICTGKKRTKFICELIGQNDFTNSSYNKASGQTFRNFCYIINFGVTITLKKQDE